MVFNLFNFVTNYIYSFYTKTQKVYKNINQIESVSFGGAGWKVFYLIGVAKALQELNNNIHNLTFSGSSVGGFVALSVLCNVPAETIFNEVKQLKLIQLSHINPFKKIYTKNSTKSYFKKLIAPIIMDTHFSRLALSTTRFNYWFLRPTLIMKKNFKSINHIDECIHRSMYIPFIMGYTPFYCKKLYFDGALMCNQPYFDTTKKEQTLTISLSNPNADIYPSVEIPFFWFLLCPKEEYFDYMYNLGYNDTINYFKC
jgi:predicted acylesterase/phospholipase RssA